MPTPKTGFSTSFCKEWHEPIVFKPVADQMSPDGYRLYDISAVSVLNGGMVLVDHRVDLMTLCTSYMVSNAMSKDVFDFVSKIRDFDSLYAVNGVDNANNTRVCKVDIRDLTFEVGFVGYSDAFNLPWSNELTVTVEPRQSFIRERAAVWNIVVSPDLTDWIA